MKTIIPLNKDDMSLLKWPAALLVFALLVSAVWCGGAYRFGQLKISELRAARTSRAELSGAVWKIEEEARIVGDYSDRYRLLQQEGIVGDEDRLELVETVDKVRASHVLFPMQLDIEPQATMILGQDGGLVAQGEGMSLRASRIVISIPLLHEKDIFSLLEGLNAMKRGIIVTEEIVVERIYSSTDEWHPEFRQNLTGLCKLLWLTISRDAGAGAAGTEEEPPPPP